MRNVEVHGNPEAGRNEAYVRVIARLEQSGPLVLTREAVDADIDCVMRKRKGTFLEDPAIVEAFLHPEEFRVTLQPMKTTEPSIWVDIQRTGPDGQLMDASGFRLPPSLNKPW